MCQISQKKGKTTKFWKDIKVVSAFQKSNCNCITHTALDWQKLQKADFAAVWGWHRNHVSPILSILFSDSTWGREEADSKAEEFCIAISATDFFRCLCWEKKKIVFLLESVSSREFKFSSHGFHGPHSFALSVLPQRTITFPLPSPSVTDQCLFSEKVLGFFLRNCIFKEIISKIHTSAFLN